MTKWVGKDMNLDNRKISERQGFRIGILENIAVGIVIIPFITVNAAGDRHFMALALGMLFTLIYGAVIFVYSKCVPDGMINALNDNLGGLAKLIDVVYVLRYVLRASLIVLFFGTVIREYMLRSYNMWWLILPFVLICGYGASRDIEKRGRLLELLFWWMIVPLIVAAVFSISNIEWNGLPGQLAGEGYISKETGFGGVIRGGYYVLIVMSTLELMMYTLGNQKKNNWKNALKTIIWIMIAVVFAYIFIIGILGGLWVGSSSTAALNVMEASAFPGGTVERMDYPVLAFWIIGVFAIVSGYMFYAKEYAGKLFRAEKTTSYMWIMLGIMALVIACVAGMQKDAFVEYVLKYLVFADIGVSLLAPVVVVIVQRKR